MKRYLFYLLFPAIFFSCMYPLHAQNPCWSIFTSENTGLPDYLIEHILVDDYNNTWAGTYGGGLVKYDGAVWKLYQMENSWMPDNSVSALAKDHYGNIWIGTYGGGLSKFDGKNWRVYIPANSQIPDATINCIVFDSENRLWFSTNEGDLVCVEGLSVWNEPVWAFYDAQDYSLHPEDFIHMMAIDNADCLWMCTCQSGLVSFDGNAFINTDGPHKNPTEIVTDQDNQIWFASEDTSYLARFDGTDWEMVEPDLPGGTPGFIYDHIISLAVDENNNLWIGTDGGIIQFDGNEWDTFLDGWQITSSVDFSDDGTVWSGSYNTMIHFDGINGIFYYPGNTGLRGNDITALKIDSDDNIWIGDRYQGLSKFNGISWKGFDQTNSSLPDYHITAIEEDESQQIWIGTNNGLAMIPSLSLEGQDWPVYNSDNSGLPANSIRCLHYGSGNLWTGTSLGLTRFDGDIWETFDSENSNLPVNGVRSVVTDNDGNIWVGTYGGGLCKIPALSLNGTGWQIFNTDNSDLPDNMVFALEADSSGNIWVGTAYSGLVKFDGSDFQIFDTDNSSIPDNHVESLILDNNKYIYVGMRYGGVARFNGVDFTVFSSENSSMPEGPVYSMDVDAYGNKWIGVDGGGVAVYNGAGVSITAPRTVSGHIFCEGGDSPLNECVVELYHTVDTAYVEQLVLSGTNAYQFTISGGLLYTIKVIPDTLSYPETLPTWNGYALTRARAYYFVVMYEDIVGKDITVIQRPPEGTGTGLVTGTLIENEAGEKKTTGLRSSATQGIPVSDCHVYLVEPTDGSVKASDITSFEGTFAFRDLEAGGYEFLADYRGTPMALTNPVVTVGSTNDTMHITAVADADKIAMEVETVSNIEAMLKSDLKAYPVPVRENLTLNFGNTFRAPDIESISIIDLHGKIRYENRSTVLNSRDVVIDMRHFMPGVYLLRIQGKEGCHYMKVVKN